MEKKQRVCIPVPSIPLSPVPGLANLSLSLSAKISPPNVGKQSALAYLPIHPCYLAKRFPQLLHQVMLLDFFAPMQIPWTVNYSLVRGRILILNHWSNLLLGTVIQALGPETLWHWGVMASIFFGGVEVYMGSEKKYNWIKYSRYCQIAMFWV